MRLHGTTSIVHFKKPPNSQTLHLCPTPLEETTQWQGAVLLLVLTTGIPHWVREGNQVDYLWVVVSRLLELLEWFMIMRSHKVLVYLPSFIPVERVRLSARPWKMLILGEIWTAKVIRESWISLSIHRPLHRCQHVYFQLILCMLADRVSR